MGNYTGSSASRITDAKRSIARLKAQLGDNSVSSLLLEIDVTDDGSSVIKDNADGGIHRQKMFMNIKRKAQNANNNVYQKVTWELVD